MTAQILEFPVIPRWSGLRQSTRYRCPECNYEMRLDHGPMWTAPMQLCGHLGLSGSKKCGAEMRPVEK